MIDTTTAVVITLATLAVFIVIGVRARAVVNQDVYLTARGSQSTGVLGLSFFASGLGAWVLFSPPEVGTFGGAIGIAGYGIAAGLPFLALAWLGPRIRNHVPAGVTLTDYVRHRFGRTAQVYVALVSVFYMFMFLTAELTAVGGVLALLGGVDEWVPIVAVALATTAYTAYGGLPASLRTDRWQGWMVLGLVGVTVGAILVRESSPFELAADGGLTTVSRTGVETLVVLAIAVTAANLFHQGYWQRIWSATDDRTLRRAALGGGLASMPVVALIAALGALAVGIGPVDAPSLALFSVLEGIAPWVLWLVVALGVALVTSSTDTIQNGLVALIASDVGQRRLSIGGARLATVLLIIPAAVIAVQGLSVLRLFLIADLFAAATVFPVFLGLWRRTQTSAVLAGAVAGIAAVVVLGWIQGGGLTDGLELVTLPRGPDVGAFGWATVISAGVTLVGSELVTRLHRARAGGGGETERRESLADRQSDARPYGTPGR